MTPFGFHSDDYDSNEEPCPDCDDPDNHPTGGFGCPSESNAAPAAVEKQKDFVQWSKQEDKYDALKKHADALSSALMWKICGSDSDNMRSVVKEYYAREGGTPVTKALVEYWQEFDGESCGCEPNQSCSRCFEPCEKCDSWGHTTREHDEWEET